MGFKNYDRYSNAIKQLNNNGSIEINKNTKRLENIPNGLLTLKKITEYLGPSIASIKPLSEGVAFSHHENDNGTLFR